MSVPKVLVAGIGNIFLGDDAFGVEVAQRLATQELPEGVRVVDFGIRGIDLTYALLDCYETVILVDAVPRGDAPGTLYVIEPLTDATPQPEASDLLIETHSLDPVKVLRLARALGSNVKRLLLVGCEPDPRTVQDDMQSEMSEPVRLAVPEAVALVNSLVAKALDEQMVTS